MGGKFSRQAGVTTRTPYGTTGDRVLTYEGGQATTRDTKSELFMLAVSNMVGEDTFYEDAAGRDQRFATLVQEVTRSDSAWMQGFIHYLRNTMQMRSASIVAAAEYAAASGPNPRIVVASAMSRADEPGEMLAYWKLRHGKHPAGGVKRGIADAIRRLYTEQAALKYDGKGRAYRMGDVIELVHPRPKDDNQRELVKYLRQARFAESNVAIDTSKLPILTAYSDWIEREAPLDSIPKGVTWEEVSSYHKMDAPAWEAIISNMGYMALLRNIRNFEQAGVSKETLDKVAAILADPERVAKSRQFPMRFLSAWVASESMTFGPALEAAVEAACSNVPSLGGRTLILIDCSSSMWHTYAARSKVMPYQAAGVFGLSLAKRAESADVYAYGSHYGVLSHSGSVLRGVENLPNLGGTQTWPTVEATYSGHDRIIILTDEQAHPSYGTPQVKRGYIFNLVGYQPTIAENGWIGFGGGLTDASFRMLELLETVGHGSWPWE